MAFRRLHGLLRRPSRARVIADRADIDPAVFSMTQSPTTAGAVTLRLYGEVDLTCRDSLRNRLTAIIAIDRVDRLLVDLDHVTFLDCSGIGSLIVGRNAALAAGCRYGVRNPRGFVNTVLWAFGVDELLGTDPGPPTAEPVAG